MMRDIISCFSLQSRNNFFLLYILRSQITLFNNWRYFYKFSFMIIEEYKLIFFVYLHTCIFTRPVTKARSIVTMYFFRRKTLSRRRPMKDINQLYILQRLNREIELDTGILTLIFIPVVAVAASNLTTGVAQREMCQRDALY